MNNLPSRQLLPEVIRDWVYDGSYCWEREALERPGPECSMLTQHYPSPIEHLTIGLTQPKTGNKAQVVFQRNTITNEVRVIHVNVDFDN